MITIDNGYNKIHDQDGPTIGSAVYYPRSETFLVTGMIYKIYLLLKVAVNTIKQTNKQHTSYIVYYWIFFWNRLNSIYITAISWQLLVLLIEETRVQEDNLWPAANNWKLDRGNKSTGRYSCTLVSSIKFSVICGRSEVIFLYSCFLYQENLIEETRVQEDNLWPAANNWKLDRGNKSTGR
jgi:hypothetical protein